MSDSSVVALDLASGRYEKLTDFGWFPKWMADSEHVLFVAESKQGYLQDLKLFAVNRSTREFSELLSQTGRSITQPTPSSDNRTLYYVETTYESDIWLISLEP